MATLRDAFDRNLEVDVKLTNVDELKTKLLTTLQTTSKTSVDIDKLASAIEKFSDIKDEIKEMSKAVGKMLDLIKKDNSTANIKKEAKLYAKAVAKEYSNIVNKVERKHHQESQKSTIGRSDLGAMPGIRKRMKSLESAIVGLTEAFITKQKEEGKEEGKKKEDKGKKDTFGERLFKQAEIKTKWFITTFGGGEKSIQNFSRGLAELGGGAIHYAGKALSKLSEKVFGLAKGIPGLEGAFNLLGGAVEQLIVFIAESAEDYQKTRQAAFITGGTTGDEETNERAEKIFEIDKLSKSTFHTNQSDSVIIESINKNLKRGIKEQTKIDRVTKSGLTTASLIGSKADDTNELFADWSQHLGASNNELSIMGRGLTQIARTSGVFGDNLLKVAKSSMTFLQTMRESGTFTAEAANNVTALLVEAQKRGVSKGMENLLALFSKSLLEGDQGSRMLAVIGAGNNRKVANQLVSGTIASDKDSLKVVATNLKKFLDQQSKTKFGVEKFEQLTPAQKGILSIVTRSATQGKFGSEEISLIAQSAEEASKSLSELITGLDEKVKKGLLTESMKEVQKRDMLLQASSVALNDFNAIVQRGGKNIDVEFAKLYKSSDELQTTFKEFALDPSKGVGAMADLLKKQSESVVANIEKLKLGEELKGTKVGPKDIDKAFEDLKKGDNSGVESIINQLNVLNEKANTQAKRNADPITKMEITLAAIHGDLKGLSFRAIDKWGGTIANFVEKGYTILKDFIANIPMYWEVTWNWLQKQWNTVSDWLAGTSSTLVNINNILNTIGVTINDIANIVDPSRLESKREELSGKLTNIDIKRTQKEAVGLDVGGLESKIAAERKELERRKVNEATQAVIYDKTHIFSGLFGKTLMQARQDAEETHRAVEQQFNVINQLEKTLKELKGGNLQQANPAEAMKLWPTWIQSGFKSQFEMANQATKEKSIYTHDMHLEELLNKKFSEMSAAMPYAGRTDDDVRKKMVTTGEKSSKDIGLIEASSKETSANTRKMVILLNNLVRLMARKKSSSGSGFEPPTLNGEPFLDEILNTEWPNSRQGRSVGLEFDMTDFA
jgi:hypothetical protein